MFLREMPMILRSLPILIAPLIALAGTAQAEAVLSIPLPMGAEASVTRLSYSEKPEQFRTL